MKESSLNKIESVIKKESEENPDFEKIDVNKINEIMNTEEKSEPDFKYEKDKDSKRLEEISQEIEKPKRISFEFDGENVQIEYIEVPAKKQMGKEQSGDKEKVLVIFPGFSTSYIPFANTVKELAQYLGDYRVICLSPLDSGKSSSLKGSNLNKMNEVYHKAFQELNIKPDKAEATVIGHSRSDIIALELARSHPEVVKNVALVNGIIANESNLPKLTYDFLKHVNVDITPARIAGAFKGEKEAAKNYWRQNKDFFKNISSPVKAHNQFKSLAERREISLENLLSELQSNVLVLSSTKELTDYEDTRKKVYKKLPADIQKQHRIEFGGLHDEITAQPEVFALKLKRWLESMEGNKSDKKNIDKED